jgi:hypothetical protein
MKIVIRLTFLLALVVFSISAKAAEPLPNAGVRQKMITDLARDMARLDGEALFVRKNRAQYWNVIVQKLRQEAAGAQNWPAFYRVFSRLNQAYPNLHSNISPGDELKALFPTPLRFKIAFQTEWLTPTNTRFTISNVDADLHLPADKKPQVGDNVTAINGRSIESWSAENFEFCKLPIKQQCDIILFLQLQKEILSWDRSQPLEFTLERAGRTWTIPVRKEDAPSSPRSLKEFYCKYDSNRYDGFQLVYTGNRLCVFESVNHPGTAVMRITSFYYGQGTLEENEKINSVIAEIENIYPWWLQNAKWNHLIIDVIDNHGGNAPIPYYEILLQHHFQEQYAKFKKTPEMNDPELRKSFFWDSNPHEIWFQKLISSGIWDRLNEGEYTPPVPMFCADDTQDCTVGQFSPRPHPFKGHVSVLVNEWCVSACDGFVYTMKAELPNNAQFYGHPQAADSAFSRITLNVVLDKNSNSGFRIDKTPLYAPPNPETLLAQTVVITQSVTAKGVIVSGIPVPIDFFVPFNAENSSHWPNAVLQKALNATKSASRIY